MASEKRIGGSFGGRGTRPRGVEVKIHTASAAAPTPMPYTANGMRKPNDAKSAPMMGPKMLPKRNAEAYSALALRGSAGGRRAR